MTARDAQSTPIRSRRGFLKSTAVAGAVAAGLSACSSSKAVFPARKPVSDVLGLDAAFKGSLPNIVLINCDDLGWGDLGCYGSKAIKTPHVDALAANGVRFTDFHACDSVCTPSRAGMLTGRYPKRMDLDFPLTPSDATLKYKAVMQLGHLLGALGVVDTPAREGASGLSEFEVTIGEALQLRGYSTAMIGKWHLGDFGKDATLHPMNHGFQSYVGVPYSNDMRPYPLYRNKEVVEADMADMGKLTGLYTDEAIKIVEGSKDKPFFLYLAHTFPHRPMFASKQFEGKSEGGLYGDTVEEIDWNLGRLMDTLRRNGLEQNTLVIFTSDNGPWYDGSAGGMRGRKGQAFEGGYRVPMVASWPARMPKATVCNQLSSNLDFFPTLLELTGVSPPGDRVVDGQSIVKYLLNPQAPATPRDMFFYHQGQLEALRASEWKLVRNTNHYVWPMPLNDNKIAKLADATQGPLPMLFNLKLDWDESYNLSQRNAPKVKEMLDKMIAWETGLAHNALGLR